MEHCMTTNRALLAFGVLLTLTAGKLEAGEPIADLSKQGMEIGARYWYSTGETRYTLFGGTTTYTPLSRLTYSDLTANSAELYFRGDTPWRIFIKGYVGAGTIDGDHFDEDFPVAFPNNGLYSRTQSSSDGKLRYGTIDLGYSLLSTPSQRVGAFIGYSHWRQDIDTYGCIQTAANPICTTPAPATLGVTERDDWNLLRLGLVAEVMLTSRLKIAVDGAYAHASMKEIDIHWNRFGVQPGSGSGNGFQVDGLLTYQLTNAFNVGVGGRWWHLTAETTTVTDQLQTYKADRYGVFVQGAYRFD
jgi:hypothetical protein